MAGEIDLFSFGQGETSCTHSLMTQPRIYDSYNAVAMAGCM